ncbi:glycosyltransferase, partial [Rahnella aceris]|uniref:glycosyltransferase n=1 Tax=Rahnella sp. (strain Y9602) TaxID=2703885 RepID=UPI001C268C66
MRIIIINSLYYPHKVGGAEVSVQMLAEDVARQGNDVLVLTLHDDKYIRKENINGVNVEYLPLRNVYWPFSGGVQHRINKLRWHIKDLYNREMIDVVESRINEFKPDVVHTNNLSGFSVGIWKLLSQLKIPLVHTTRDYYLFHPNSTLFKNGKNMSLNNILVRFNKYYKGVMSNH